MKTTVFRYAGRYAGFLPAAILIATGISVVDPARANTNDIASDAAHRLAQKFALNERQDTATTKIAVNETAAQLAAERAAMKEAQAAAKTAREQAELKAYREDLLKRARREAAERRQAAAKRKGSVTQSAAKKTKTAAQENKSESLAESRIKAAQARAAARKSKKAAAKKKRRIATLKAEAKAKKEAAARAEAARRAKAEQQEEKRLAKMRLAEMQRERERELRDLDRKLQRLKERDEQRKTLAARKAKKTADADKRLAAARAADEQAAADRLAERHRLAAEQRAAQKIEKVRQRHLSEQKLAEKRRKEKRRLAERRLAEKTRIEKQLAARRQAAEQKRKSNDWRRVRQAEKRLEEQKIAERNIAERRLAEQQRVNKPAIKEPRFAAQPVDDYDLRRSENAKRTARLQTEEDQWKDYFGANRRTRSSVKSYHRRRLNEAMNEVQRSTGRRANAGRDQQVHNSDSFDSETDALGADHERANSVGGSGTYRPADRSPGWNNRYSVNRGDIDDTDAIVRRRRSMDDAPIDAPSFDRADPKKPMVTSRRVTVLLVMRPGNRGIRRHNKTADPVLCTSGGCYVSRGIGRPAKFKSRRRTLGMFNTFGRRAGACNHQLGCIFRNVDLSRGSLSFQPVDLRMVHHDRRSRQLVTAPRYTRGSANLRHCRVIYRTRDYELIVVPEEVANNAGPAALQAMLDERMAAVNPRHRNDNVLGSMRYRR